MKNEDLELDDWKQILKDSNMIMKQAQIDAAVARTTMKLAKDMISSFEK